MAMVTQEFTDEKIELAGTSVQLIKGGTGDPLLIVHGELGHPGWLNYHQSLAQNNTLYIPSPPGFGLSVRLDWIMNMRDMAGWYLEALDELGIGQVNIMGFSLGGWLAAEMATMCPDSFNKLVLVDSAGIRPPTGEIYDMFLVVAREFIQVSFLDPSTTQEFAQICPEEPTPELAEAWEVAREQACRLAWKPYMYYPGLPHLLARLKNLSTLIVWGRQDPIIPLSAGEVFHQSIPGSRLAVIDDCGHHPEMEQTEEFVRIVSDFLS